MNNPDTEILFPMRAIPNLADLRGVDWQNLVSRVAEQNEENVEKIAFSALVIKLAGCMGCTADSYRALRGCTQCARLVIKRFKGTDGDLQRNYDESLVEIMKYLEKRKNLTFPQDY
jgi:hypothetical protein